MVDIVKIKRLIEFIQKKGIRRFAIEEGDFKIEVELEGKPSEEVKILNREGEKPPFSSPIKEPWVAPSGSFVTAPIVGTFYPNPSPETPPFIKVGDVIEPDTVVCIIEAMKVMNEIKAGVKGTVVEVLVENGAPVEFGAKLFRVK